MQFFDKRPVDDVHCLPIQAQKQLEKISVRNSGKKLDLICYFNALFKERKMDNIVQGAWHFSYIYSKLKQLYLCYQQETSVLKWYGHFQCSPLDADRYLLSPRGERWTFTFKSTKCANKCLLEAVACNCKPTICQRDYYRK